MSASGGDKKVSKASVHFREGSERECCKLCTMFLSHAYSKSGSCTLVAGFIGEDDLCDKFEPEKSMEKAYVGFAKLKNKLAGKYGEEAAAKIAAAIGRKKYGKKRFQEDNSEGKKMDDEQPIDKAVSEKPERYCPSCDWAFSTRLAAKAKPGRCPICDGKTVRDAGGEAPHVSNGTGKVRKALVLVLRKAA